MLVDSYKLYLKLLSGPVVLVYSFNFQVHVNAQNQTWEKFKGKPNVLHPVIV